MAQPSSAESGAQDQDPAPVGDDVTASATVLEPSRWVERHADALFRYAYVRLLDRDLAEDRVQETFVAALEARESFRGGSTERTWLIGILKHKIVDFYRRRSRDENAGSPTPADQIEDLLFDQRGIWKETPERWPSVPVTALLERDEFWRTLERCASKLPEKLRETFCLRDVQDLSTEDVCNTMNVTSTSCSTQLHRARMALRRCLELNWFTRK